MVIRVADVDAVACRGDLCEHGSDAGVGALAGDERSELAEDGQRQHLRADVRVIVGRRDVDEIEHVCGDAGLQELQPDVDVAIPAAGALRHDGDRCLVVNVDRDLGRWKSCDPLARR